MEKTLLFLLAIVAITNLLQGLEAATVQDERRMIKRRLRLINKPSLKSFVFHGDILDCVDIRKQHAFDHPLLKNHSIQMKPNFKFTPLKTSKDNHGNKILSLSQLVPKNIECPRGTVLVKRIQEKELPAMEKFSRPLFGMTSSFVNSSNDVGPAALSYTTQAANLQAVANNTGASGFVNVWNPSIKPEQYSEVYIYVANDDDKVNEGVSAGWMVNPSVYGDTLTRLFGYWNRFDGTSNGCYNTLCQGFVQVSQKTSLGVVIKPVSTYGGTQFELPIFLQLDPITKNWWLRAGQENVGYWPSEIFVNLPIVATRASWGGQVGSPLQTPTPAMGSGHFPEELYSQSCFIIHLELVGAQFPDLKDLRKLLTQPVCYKLLYFDGSPDINGHELFFGGPPNCKL